MPYKAPKHPAYLHVNKPRLAAKWDSKYGGQVVRQATKKRTKKK